MALRKRGQSCFRAPRGELLHCCQEVRVGFAKFDHNLAFRINVVALGTRHADATHRVERVRYVAVWRGRVAFAIRKAGLTGVSKTQVAEATIPRRRLLDSSALSAKAVAICIDKNRCAAPAVTKLIALTVTNGIALAVRVRHELGLGKCFRFRTRRVGGRHATFLGWKLIRV